MTLTEFLEPRIAEDEAMAREAGPDWISYQKADDYGMDDNTATHVVTFSPARVLAECDAKRQIIEMHEPFQSETRGECCWICGPGGAPWPCETLRAITLPYADHSDYLEEWRV